MRTNQHTSESGAAHESHATSRAGSVRSRPSTSGKSRKSSTVPQARWIALTIITVLAPTLGGSTSRWAEGIILGLVGLVLIISPPRHSLGTKINVLCGALLLVAFTAFLPARWFGVPGWRSHAVALVHLPLPQTLTPQPWLTGEAIILLAGGLAWFYLLREAQFGTIDRSGPLRGFTVGIALLGTVSLIFYVTGIRWPFPESVAHFGPFPNKNQTASVLAIGALASFACVYDALRFRRRVILWIVCAAVDMVGLVMANSRGAILAFLVGLIVWLGILALVNRSRSLAAAGIATLSFLLLAFVLFGGQSMNRFHNKLNGGQDLSEDLRWSIQQDAFHMSLTSPVVGVGLGNFRCVFALFHNALSRPNYEIPQMGSMATPSAPTDHVLASPNYDIVHPESDWLWIMDELGWPAFGMVFIGGVILLFSALPFRADQPNWHLHAAGFAAGLVFLIHGFVDVGGHRFGSVFAALFAMSFAVDNNAIPVAGIRRQLDSRGAWIQGLGWRLGGVLLLGVGTAWTWAAADGALFPGALGVAAAETRAPLLNAAGKFQEAIDVTTPALRWAPMDWVLYYDRAVAESLNDEKSVPAAVADFQRARFLQPTISDVPYNEGVVWLHVKPDLLFQAWKDALECGHSDESRLFQIMMQSATQMPESLPTLRRLAGEDPTLQIIYCTYAPHKEAAEMIQHILGNDPVLGKLSDDQKRTFFKLWADNSDRAFVAQRILGNQDWLSIGWPVAIDYLVSTGDYRRAYEITRKFSPPPSAPPNEETTSSRAALAARFYADSSDFAAGVALCRQYAQAGQSEDALIQSEKMTARGDCPAYIFALQADLHASRQEWQQAFESLKKSPPPPQ